MTTNHKYYLDLAFKIAEINLGKTKLNPSVGTVIVKNNTVISRVCPTVSGYLVGETTAGNTFTEKLTFIAI